MLEPRVCPDPMTLPCYVEVQEAGEVVAEHAKVHLNYVPQVTAQEEAAEVQWVHFAQQVKDREAVVVPRCCVSVRADAPRVSLLVA